ncbi:MAG TPA: outer membrane beta-barrel protein [Xanthobacteraceae bacterium]|nr:outer membrane beta-barrel protein [Xanthobacteraceae bacterium]
MHLLARSAAIIVVAASHLAMGSPGTFAQSNDEILRRLEAKIDALAKENAALRERVRRLERAKTDSAKPETTQTAASKIETTTAAAPAAIPSTAMEAQARAVSGVVAARANRWTGLYVGGSGGFAWGNPTTATSNNNSTTAFNTSVFVPLNPAEYHARTTGWTAGVLAGLNHQLNNRLVIGGEGDFSWTDLDGTVTKTTICAGYAGGDPNCTYTQSQRLRWLATLRGRLGFLVIPDTVIYGTAGLAAGRVSFSHSLRTTGFAGTFTAAATGADTKAGWVVGTGIETWLAPNWIMRLEYLHYDLGTVSSTAPILAPGPTGTSARADFRVYGDVARGSLIYKLD